MNKNEVLAVLNKAKVCVDKNVSMIGGDCFVFHNNKLYASDEATALILPCPIEETFAVKAFDFIEAVKAMKVEEFTITVSDSIVLKSGKTIIELPMMDNKVQTMVKSITPIEPIWRSIPPDFMDALKLTMVQTSKNDALNSVYISGEKMYATDRHFIMETTFDGNVTTVWLDNVNIKTLVAFGEMKEYCVENAWIHFRNETEQFSCRSKSAEQYPISGLKRPMAMLENVVWCEDTLLVFDIIEDFKDASAFCNENVDIILGESTTISSNNFKGKFHNVIEKDTGLRGSYSIKPKRFIEIGNKDNIQGIGFVNNDKGTHAIVAHGGKKNLTWKSFFTVDVK